MARPKSDMPKKQYAVMLYPDTVEKIDKLANKLHLSRSQLMANMIDTALEEVEMLDKFGFFKAVLFGEKVFKKIKEGFVSGRLYIDKKGDIQINE